MLLNQDNIRFINKKYQTEHKFNCDFYLEMNLNIAAHWD